VVRDGDVEVGFRESEDGEGLAPMAGRGFCGLSAATFTCASFWRAVYALSFISVTLASSLD
jgi:hypothetical protein